MADGSVSTQPATLRPLTDAEYSELFDALMNCGDVVQGDITYRLILAHLEHVETGKQPTAPQWAAMTALRELREAMLAFNTANDRAVSWAAELERRHAQAKKWCAMVAA